LDEAKLKRWLQDDLLAAVYTNPLPCRPVSGIKPHCLALRVCSLINQCGEESLELPWKLIRAFRVALYSDDKTMVRTLQGFH
jgi:hypothetical protein